MQRVAAVAVMAAFLVSAAVEHLTWRGLSWGVGLVDLALAVGLFRLSMSGRRWWLHAASAYAVINALVHLTAFLDPSIWWLAYINSRWVLSALVLLTPLFGFWEEPMARRYFQAARPSHDKLRSRGHSLAQPDR